MKLSDKLQIEINEARNRVLELAEIEEPTEENRAELKDLSAKMKTLTERQAVAKEAEEIEIREIAEDKTQEDGEAKELSDIIAESRLSPFIQAAFDPEKRSVDGREAELKAALEIDGDYDFPMALLVDWSGSEDEQQRAMIPEHLREEHRVDTATNISFATMVQSSAWLSRLFATTNAAFIGVTTRAVGAGEHIYPFVAGSAAASTPDKNAAVDAPTATIETKTHTPRAVQSRYVISEEDRIKLGNAYENALRSDLRNQLMAGLDNFVFANSADGMLTTIPAVASDADLSAASTFEAMHTNVLSAIDGLYASELIDLNVSCSADAYGRMASVAPSGTSAFLTDYLRVQGCGVRANAHIGGISGKTNQSYAIASRSRGIAGAAVMSVYRAGSMNVDMSGGLMQRRQVALNVVGFFDFDAIRTANWIKFRIRHA